MIAFLALTFLTAAAVAISTLQTILTVLFRRGRSFFVDGLRQRAASASRQAGFIRRLPFVSILKPVCGLEDDLENNLLSFTALRDIDYEIIVSIAEREDPALPIVERVRMSNPALPLRVVIGGNPELEDGNRKVARLIAAQPYARGEILFISDANVRVGPQDVARTVAMLADRRVGCVSNLFTGAGAISLGARVESLHLLSFVVPGNVLAAFAGVPCVVGKSMAISQTALRAIGGFERFARVLAEDQAIGLAVAEAGFQLRLSPAVVRNVVVRRSVRRAVDRQIRWNKIRYAFSRATYSAEFLVNPLPFALLAALIFGPQALWMPLAIVGIRIAQMAALSFAMSVPFGLRDVLVVPLLDVLQFAAQFVPYVDDRVTWRGYSARLGPNTQLIEIASTRAAA
jgi:ceramide glucosyltransferase